MPLVLEPLAGSGSLSVEIEGVVPDRLRTLAATALARLPIDVDGHPADLGSAFRLRGSAADGRIECEGDFSRVHRIGAGMAEGDIVVRGPVGRHAAAGMTGGTLVVAGDAGDWLAVEMSGGTVRVGGDAGDNVAGALPGSDLGMRGGTVLVAGSVGHLAGARLRRGVLAIGGGCGSAAGFEMRAGTVLVCGGLGPHPGLGMRRGSVVAAGPRPDVPPTFTRGAVWSPGFLPLLANHLRRHGFPADVRAAAPLSGPWQQWHGDTLTGGRGEIWHR